MRFLRYNDIDGSADVLVGLSLGAKLQPMKVEEGSHENDTGVAGDEDGEEVG